MYSYLDYLFEGYAGSSHYSHTGGGSNILCLPDNPQWGDHVDGFQNSAQMFGSEYQFSNNQPFFSTINNNNNPLQNYDVPCAMCLASTRSSQIMIPARRECPADWTMEYRGYLVSNHYNHQKNEFICMDEAPDTIGSTADNDGNLFYTVEAVCGSLPCLPYASGWELTCVVCTK